VEVNRRASKTVDVRVERRINAAPEAVAAAMFEPSREPEWMKAVKEAGRMEAGTGVGSKAWQRGGFLGMEIRWTTEVTEYSPGRRLTMRIDGGPFQGTVTYSIEPLDQGSVVAIRNEGEPTAFAWLPRWLLEAAMRGAMAKDLERLGSLVER
jgi:uncharacterized protein YndB with AHSA1/START domain